MVKFLIGVVGIFMAFSSVAIADGKFYTHPDSVPPHIPYQRAIISYQAGEELLILQTKFSGAGKDFGWVIPVPDQPKIGSMTENDADFLFRELSGSTEPSEIPLTTIICAILLCLSMIWMALRLFYAITKRPVPKFLKGSPIIPVIIFLILCCGVMSIPNLLSSKGVEILSAQQVGVYDVKVIKASNASDLIAWLNEHQYKFTADDERVFGSYIHKGWCFVTARINPDELLKDQYRSYNKLVNPLVLVFSTKEAVYPLSLTATAGSETEILLYVFGAHKTAGDTRFKIEFAGNIKTIEQMLQPRPYTYWLKEKGEKTFKEMISYTSPLKIESKDDLNLSRFAGQYVTKLRAKLLPEQMREDLILNPSADDNPYRKYILR